MSDSKRDFVIRQALFEERDAIRQFVCDNHIAYSGYSEEAVRLQTEDLPNDFPELIIESQWDPAHCWVCSKEGVVQNKDDILGCIGIRKVDGDRMNLVYLYVAEETRGQGLGRQLLHLIVNWARVRKFQSISLYTLKDVMASAVKLYQSEGFQITEETQVTCFVVLTMTLDLGATE